MDTTDIYKELDEVAKNLDIAKTFFKYTVKMHREAMLHNMTTPEHHEKKTARNENRETTIETIEDMMDALEYCKKQLEQAW